MAHRADTPISQHLLTSLHNILDHTNLTISDIADMMGADKAKLRRLAYGRVQELHFSGFVERLELTLADIGGWIVNNGHNDGIIHYVRNSHRKYSMQAVALNKKAPKKVSTKRRKAKSKRFKTGAHFTGRRLVERKAEMETVVKEARDRLAKSSRFNSFINFFLVVDLVLLTTLMVVMIVQAFRS